MQILLSTSMANVHVAVCHVPCSSTYNCTDRATAVFTTANSTLCDIAICAMQLLSVRLSDDPSCPPVQLHMLFPYVMHHCCRPVDCSTQTVLPLKPGFINKTIYKDQVETGWGVGTSGSAVRRLQQSKNGMPTPSGLPASNASCFDLPKPTVRIQFNVKQTL